MEISSIRNKQLIKEEARMSRNVQKSAHSHWWEKMQFKLTMNYHFKPIRLRRKKKIIIPESGESNEGNKKSFFSEDGNSNHTTALKINLTISNEVKNVHLPQPQSTTMGPVHQRNSYTSSWGKHAQEHTQEYTQEFHCSTCDSKKVEATEMFISGEFKQWDDIQDLKTNGLCKSMWINLLKGMGQKASCKRYHPLSNWNTTQNNMICPYMVKCQNIHGRLRARVVTLMEEKEKWNGRDEEGRFSFICGYSFIFF